MVTKEILEFCSEIDSNTSPVCVQVMPVDGVRHGYCFTDVPAFATENGGTVQFGWVIWECPRVAQEAEFHACWVSSEGKCVDIVPKQDGETTILFLPDSKRVFEHKSVSNIQKALIDNEYTKRWLIIARKKDEIRAKYFKDDKVDSLAASLEFTKWLSTIWMRPINPGRNDPCPCGSGRKYEKCCGRLIQNC